MAKKEINGTKSKEQEMKLKLSSKVTRVKSSLQGKQLSVARETQLRKCLSCLSQVSPGTWLRCMVRSVNATRFLMQKNKPASVYSICVENLRQTEFLQRKSDFSSHPKVLVGRVQEKPLQEEETPLEGKEAQPFSPQLQVCRRGGPLCIQVPGAAASDSPARTPALSDSPQSSARSFSLLCALSQSWGRGPGPGCLLKASSQGNPRGPSCYLWPAVPSRSWKDK